MARLPTYQSFEEKDVLFKAATTEPYAKIESTAAFNSMYDRYSKPYNTDDKYNYFFRGLTEARYQLYTSSQRIWITNQMKEWGPSFTYLQFVQKLIDASKEEPLFKKVFDFYGLLDSEVDFPLLSVLQHYGAPTPLMDWSYNLDVALYFATEDVSLPANPTNPIDDYFSVYVINKTRQRSELKSIFEYIKGAFPSVLTFQEDDSNPNSNFVVYISDFEGGEQQSHNYTLTASAAPSVKRTQNRPMTVYFNQNILPQEGLFIFSPYSEKTLEQCFNAASGDFNLAPFMCYNIKKDLAEYIRRKIGANKITSGFIYPKLNEFIKTVKERTINSLFAKP
jgi:hypothetical protein